MRSEQTSYGTAMIRYEMAWNRNDALGNGVASRRTDSNSNGTAKIRPETNSNGVAKI